MNRTVFAIMLIATNMHGTPASASKSSKMPEKQPSTWLGAVTRVQCAQAFVRRWLSSRSRQKSFDVLIAKGGCNRLCE
jgi:hypothetical protein